MKTILKRSPMVYKHSDCAMSMNLAPVRTPNGHQSVYADMCRMGTLMCIAACTKDYPSQLYMLVEVLGVELFDLIPLLTHILIHYKLFFC